MLEGGAGDGVVVVDDELAAAEGAEDHAPVGGCVGGGVIHGGVVGPQPCAAIAACE